MDKIMKIMIKSAYANHGAKARFIFAISVIMLFAGLFSNPYVKGKAAEGILPQTAFAAEKPGCPKTAQPPAASENEVTEEEYRVFTDFIKTEKFPRIESPHQYEIPSDGLLYEKTEQRSIKDMGDAFGTLDAALIDDYNNRNTREYLIKGEYLIKDRILLNKISMLSEKTMRDIIKKGIRLELRRRFPFYNKIIYLSRVGFSSDKTKALFSVRSTNGFNGGSHFILMEKTGDAWRLKEAVLNSSWIY